MYYALVILSTVLLSVEFCSNKTYQKWAGVAPAASFAYNALLGAFQIPVFLVLNKFRFEFTPFSAVMAFCMAICALLYTVIGLKMMSSGKMTIYTLFLMSGGMTLPYLFGIVFWNEAPSVLRIFGILMILGGVIIANTGKERPAWKFILLGVLVFVLNGCVSILSKAHQIEAVRATVSSASFGMLSAISTALFSGCAIAVFAKKTPEDVRAIPMRRVVPLIAGTAIIHGISYLLQLIGAVHLPATVLYPIITGGAIVFTAFAGWIAFREKPNARMWIGIVLCFIGTCLFV